MHWLIFSGGKLSPAGIRVTKLFLLFIVVPVFGYVTWTQLQSSGTAVTVLVNNRQVYQTIDGFGGTEHWLFPPSSEYSRIFDDLGASILRFRMLQYLESSPDQPGNELENDNDDPFVIDWNRVKTQYFANLAPLLKTAQSRKVKIFGTILSPPPWMKTNNAHSGEGSLKPGYEDELVEFILIWIEGMKRYHRVRIDYVNFENEPNYQRKYDGYLMSAGQIRDLTKRLSARLIAAKIDTKIVPPETTNLPTFSRWTSVICQDIEANAYIHRLTTHSYNIDFFDADQNIDNWIAAYNVARSHGKLLWMTEYCHDYGELMGSWSEALNLAQHVHNALFYGHVSAWLYHELYRDPSKKPIALIDENGPYRKFYALKQYFQYIRPDAVRIKAESNDKDILVTAFTHKTNRTISIVVINRHHYSKSLTFNLSGLQGLSSLDVIRTSEKENARFVGEALVINNNLTFVMPKKSVTTLTGTFILDPQGGSVQSAM